jgi:signal peptidase II
MQIEVGERPSVTSSPEQVPPPRLSYILALATVVLDQASKLFVLHGLDLEQTQPLIISRFFDLILVWNRGISYGLFQQDKISGQMLLLAGTVIAILGLMIWMARVKQARLAVGLGFLTGGAAGNAIDRAAYGAVVDFLHLHWDTWSWYVFNLADAAIVVGVFILMYDSWQADKGAAHARVS